MRCTPVRRGTGMFGALLLIVSAGGCARETEREVPVTWKDEIQALLSAQCSTCHTGPSAPGNYRTTSYTAVLEGGSDEVPNAVAGDETSRLLTVLEGKHLGYLGEGDEALARKALLRRWVVDDDLAYFWSAAHPPSILNPASEDFHGHLVEREGYDLSRCRRCHGEDYAGGAVGVPCTTCHPSTPEACNTCHGSETNPAPPRAAYEDHDAGAHQVHLTVPSGRFRPIACATCHKVPDHLGTPGHVDNADGAAEITFSGLATADGATPSFDHETDTCENTYCHGGRSGGNAPAPSWDDEGIFDECDGCHGFPPTTTPDGNPHPPVTTCAYCHPATVDAEGKIIDPNLHLDGVVETRPGIKTCGGCHSSPEQPTPFHDPFGETDPTQPSVGAHGIHAGANPFHEGSNGFGYACENCHLVPATIGDPDHIDGDMQAEVTFGGVATAFGMTPSYDPVTHTCQDVWCHGAGLDGGGSNPTPAWTDPSVRFVCGTCHGLPPAQILSAGTPVPHPSATTCEACHQQVIDASFNFVDRSKHIDGIVEVGP